MKHLAQQHVLILGLGLSGLALARWCARCGAQVTVVDTRAAPPQLQALRETVPSARFVTSEMVADLVLGSDIRMVLKSPGLTPAAVAPVIEAAQAQGLPCGNELSLFAQALADLKETRGYAPQVIGITGTNGKTTVTSLAGQLVQRAGKSVAVAGNIGPTLLDTLAEKLDQEPEPEAVSDAEPVPSNEPVDAADMSAQPPLDEQSAGEDADSASVHEQDPDHESEGSTAELAEDALSALVAPADDETAVILPSAPPAVTVFHALPEVWVLELSSFQLDGVSNFEPTVATVLNVTQDHLDWHGSLATYAAAKARVYGHGLMLLNRDDPLVMAAMPAPLPLVRGKQPRGRAYMTFGSDAPQRPGDYGIETVNGMAWLVRAAEADETIKRRKGEEIELHVQRLMPVEALRIHGRHNATNALAALALAGAAGCGMAAMLHGLREYTGEPHRVASVAVIRDVEYFDDSKGTNVGATVAALVGLGAERKLVLIAGGDGKGQDFSPLAEPVRQHARAVILIGRDAPALRAALEATGVPLLDAASMEAAVAMAAHHAQTGDAVLMSPACASFDMFDNYEHRAQVFCQAVDALALDAGDMA
ncbi:UDP-N-acetylmuramoyl-L-alanine--D-glutamate ligase [Polaromonas sp. SM01]|uniref:UDP-N-acetylmuramoyl-L-alanine--D-glutamate ligase n=1 Tax=Polaromonas sp. SM01 TaxID=3085630 RepID=UPI002981663D|nr:UDP-N-acetylmuramoyl-L-alanine--D-glutamate ligase [Polaromonas sp. SM01]MDW5445010.1 UDP-N-acetylmuramoyl-L-alanine--D-glutamate ligase [Polaromonas sp. SM01]